MSEHTSHKEPLFQLDKEILDFDFKIGKSANLGTFLIEKPVSKILVKNISKYPLAVRIVTTKKDLYLVNPSYSLININESEEIKFTYISKQISEDTSTHKFKFQAVSILPEIIHISLKQIFEIYSRGEIKGFKTDEKGMRVIFHETNEENNMNCNQNNPNITDPSNTSVQNVNNSYGNIYASTNNGKQDNSLNYNDININHNQEKLNMELRNLNAQLELLKNSNNELNAKIKNANEQTKTTFGQNETSSLIKNRKTPISNNFNNTIELGIETKLLLISCLVMLILGFILTK